MDIIVFNVSYNGNTRGWGTNMSYFVRENSEKIESELDLVKD